MLKQRVKYMPYHYPHPQLKLEICISQLLHENQCGIQVKPCWTRLGTGWMQIQYLKLDYYLCIKGAVWLKVLFFVDFHPFS